MLQHILWKNNKLVLLDQRMLPLKTTYVICKTYVTACDAIRDMVVRGAPAIGISAAYGIAQAMLEGKSHYKNNVNAREQYFTRVCNAFAQTRPTAVNLFWAIQRMGTCFHAVKNTNHDVCAALVHEAKAIHREDIAMNKAMGAYGASLFTKKMCVLTHCNAGTLATGGYGTALGVLRTAHAQKKIEMVYVDETRPYLQGLRLTAYELMYDKIPMTLICDNMAGYLMGLGKIDAVIIGADRIAANGDTANKIGSYSLSVLAKHHGIPFWVAAPTSTIDCATCCGKDIVIEERDPKEITHFDGKLRAPRGVRVFNPSFDVVPHENISAIITEKGVITGAFKANLRSIAKTLNPKS